MEIKPFFDPDTWTLTYVVHQDGVGVVIDSVLDYDPASGRTSTRGIDAVSDYIDAEQLEIPYVLDTHAHADHITAMQVLKDRSGAKTVIGAGITGVQETFKKVFHLGDEFAADGSQFDVLINGGTSLQAGPLEIEAIHTPGHTKACLTYKIGDALFVGELHRVADDTAGTGRLAPMSKNDEAPRPFLGGSRRLDGLVEHD